MENVSKALIIAGEMLIAMLIVGLITSTVAKFGKFSSSMNSKMQKNKQEEFNNHFLAFQGRIDISAAEIAGIINYAKSQNDKSELFLYSGKSVKSSPDFVNVITPDGEFFKDSLFGSNRKVCEQKFTNAVRDFVQNNNTKYFMCDAKIKSITPEGDKGVINTMVDISTPTENRDILFNTEDNGRMNYVKSIRFKVTKADEIGSYYHDPSNKYLDIYNRSDFIIY